MTTLFIIWCIIGTLITNMMFASEHESDYRIGLILVAIFLGWLLGAFILIGYLGLIIPKLLYKPFNRAYNFFEKFIK